MSAAETVPANAKTGGGTSGGAGYSPTAAWVLLILIVIVTIYVTQTQGRRGAGVLCSKQRVVEFASDGNLKGLKEISESCAHSGAGWAARRALSAATMSAEMQGGGLTPAGLRSGANAGDGHPSSKEALAGAFVAQLYIGTTRDGAEAYGDWIVERHCDLACGFAVSVARARHKGYAPEHRVLIGPLAVKRDADSLCEAFKARGVDCFPKMSQEALN